MIRTIDVSEITKNVKEMCIEANYYLSDDMKNALQTAGTSDRGKSGRGCQCGGTSGVCGRIFEKICGKGSDSERKYKG